MLDTRRSMTIGLYKKLHLEITQKPYFCKFSRKNKGYYLCFSSKITKKCDILGQNRILPRNRKTLRTCRKTQNIEFFKKIRQ